MRRLKFSLIGGFAILTLSWAGAEWGAPLPSGFIAIRDLAIQYSGFVAYWTMSLAVILAARPRAPERALGGLDRVYRMHKWLGIAGLTFAVLHWAATQAPPVAAALGLISGGRPPRGAPPEITDPVRQMLMSLRGPAEGLGEWMFYIAVVLIALALVHRVSYSLFAKSHRVFPIVYLILTFHSVVFIKPAYWPTPLGVLTGLLMVAGVVAAFWILLRRVGTGRKARGTVAEVVHYPVARATRIDVDVPTGWPGHRAGQFAFLTVSPATEAHPFTIASDWSPDERRIGFVVKDLGDHTRALRESVARGTPVVIEGPYGGFVFDDGMSRQIWIGGGIGITPFVAKLRERAARREREALPEVDLFHATSDFDELAVARLTVDAMQAGVRLHVVGGPRGRLTGERIRELVPEWREAGIWFCGPSAFGEALRTDFAACGHDVDRAFHQEFFALR